MELETALAKALDEVSTSLTPQIITGEGNEVFHLEWDNMNKITTNIHGSNVVNSTGGIMIQEVKPGFDANGKDQKLPSYERSMACSLKVDTPETLAPIHIYNRVGPKFTTDKEILNHCEAFYRNLYSSKTDPPNEKYDHIFFEASTEKKLNQIEQDSCEGSLTRAECLKALKEMDSNKTPGSDGLPAEFYKIFWNDIADFLLGSINYAYKTGQLSVSQKRGIVKLIPKKDAEPYYVKNWRPISLLNCDYKLATKAVANRLKQVLPKLIDNDQTGFLKGRFIGENIRLIDSVINFTAAKNIPGLLVFLDFEKAFDTVEWPFIQKTFQHFNFGPSIISWIKLFYHDIETCILNNGWSSNFFKLERGVRQGCPLSPYLFILCAEVLADAIRNDNNIKGITVDGQEIKISLYADDTTLILDGSRASFQNSLQVLELFSLISGLRLNYKKTEVLWIGANAGSEEKLCPEHDLKWMKNKVKTLGVWLSTDPIITMKANYDEKLTKLKASLSCWELRRLSLLGKITVLKSLIVSQLTYILSPLPTNHCAVDEVNTLFFKFLWNGKGDKIKRDVMISEYEDGGLKMIDIRLFTQALKLNWVKKYLDTGNHAKWKLFFNLQLRDLGGGTIFKGNLHKKDLLAYFKVSDVFLQEILQTWSNINYEDNISSKEQLLSQYLWLNSLIRVNNKPIHYPAWSSQGIQNIGHLMENETRFLSFSEFKERYNIKTNFLSFCGVISAIKRILWHEDNIPGKQIIEYRMNVHLFGNGPSPAVATFGLRKTAADGEEEFGEEAPEFVHRNFYVDDGLASRPTAQQAIDLVTSTQAMLATANLRLHKVMSNTVEVMEAFPPKIGVKEYAIWIFATTACPHSAHSESIGTLRKTLSPSRSAFPTNLSREEEYYQWSTRYTTH